MKKSRTNRGIKRLLRLIFGTVLGLVGCYMLYAGFFFLLQRSLIFPRFLIPRSTTVLPHTDNWQSVWLEVGSYRTEAWFFKAPAARPDNATKAAGLQPALIIAHGSAQLIDHWQERVAPLASLGVHVLLVEFPGYGRSGGSPAFTSLKRSFIKAYDWLAARSDVDPARIILFGYSLGAGAVTALAAERPAAAIILLATFTNAYDLARGMLLPPCLVRDPFDNLTIIRFFAGPVLILYAKEDNLFSYEHALKLYRAADKAQLIAYEGGHRHNIHDWDTFWQSDVKDFLMHYRLLN